VERFAAAKGLFPIVMSAAMPQNALARNTAWMILGRGLGLIIQAAYFIEIARSLGVSNYGAFVGVVALVGIVWPFASVGGSNLLIKNVSRDKSLFALYWGRALTTTAAFGSLLIVFVLLLSLFVLPRQIPLLLVALVAASDILALNVVTIASQTFQAFERLDWTAGLGVLMIASRLAGAIILIAIYPHPSALQWGYSYFGSAAVVAVLASLVVCKKLGFPVLNWRRSPSEMREGFWFSTSQSAQTVYNDIDKTMLARLATLDATGIYGAAYRLIDVSFVPVSALLYSAYPNFFRAGADGISSSLRYAKPLLLRAGGYSLVVCAAILLCAGWVPYVLGPDYARIVEALRWLAVLPVLKAMHYFLADTLTGAGYQAVRTCIQAGVGAFNILINLWLIPAYSWRGAAWASIASDALLLCGVGSAVFLLSRQRRGVLVAVAANANAD
jgi:O-antigen/teichoic acid export membrane protein